MFAEEQGTSVSNISYLFTISVERGSLLHGMETY